MSPVFDTKSTVVVSPIFDTWWEIPPGSSGHLCSSMRYLVHGVQSYAANAESRKNILLSPNGKMTK